MGVIRRRRTSDDGERAQGGGDTVRGSELIPRAGDETDCLLNQKTRETLEREAFGKSA